MKRLMMIVLAVVTLSAQAQKEEKEAPKPNINKAVTLTRQAKFDEAKAIADAIPTHSKTMNDAKSWLVRGIVYAAMDTSSKYTGGAKDNSKVAGEAFNKAIALAGPKAMSVTVIDNGETLNIIDVRSRVNNKFLNTGDKLFKEEKFAEAVIQLEKGLDITPDSSIYQYAGYAAYNSEDIDKAILYIGKYIEMGGRNEQATFLRVGSLFEFKRDYPASVEAARQALKMFPNNANIRKIELNSLIQLKRYEEATENLKTSIKADPKDVESYFLMGALYEELKNRAESKRYFEETVKLDPKHLNASLALAKISDSDGGYKYVKAEMDKLDYRDKAQKAKLEELDKVYMAKVGEAATIWEKVHKIDANNTEVLWNMLSIYGILDAKDKYNQTKAKLKALGEQVDD
jgi:tetratricopeptide (TPR) repeat protein